MPYIAKGDREWLDSSGGEPLTPGELNYVITMMLVRYLQRNGCNYARINDCLGALEGAKLEFYRRRVAPFEDEKRTLTGDVY